MAKKLFVRFFEGFDDCCLPAGFNPAKDYRVISFPGGNDTVARHFLKAIRPEVIAGGSSFEAVSTGALDLSAFDAPGVRARIRTRSTAI
ncbi:MAG: hypothetical protein IPJ97_08645 [Proteobacteria bacterium]|nr:hypothetical protein [Pseudomonadota bacterium]